MFVSTPEALQDFQGLNRTIFPNVFFSFNVSVPACHTCPHGEMGTVSETVQERRMCVAKTTDRELLNTFLETCIVQHCYSGKQFTLSKGTFDAE